jgi:hypothetical protein
MALALAILPGVGHLTPPEPDPGALSQTTPVR